MCFIQKRFFVTLKSVFEKYVIFRKAFEEGENAICEEILIQDNINISSSEEYVDIDSFNEDNITLNSDDSPDHDNFEEEDEGSKF